jgi:hypothetical protein
MAGGLAIRRAALRPERAVGAVLLDGEAGVHAIARLRAVKRRRDLSRRAAAAFRGAVARGKG